MDVTVKIVSIHLVAAVAAALIATAFTIGILGFTNHVFAFVIGVVILYFVGQLCQKLYGEDAKGFSTWLWDGILPFGFFWFILWTILTNYL
ncbi:hypothetical protein SAMN02910297_01378 [Methanobrevibacter olleyae]|uniref:Uncharacterized protein n=1 Tax=Methanobrevibacter olleyae TaxID=294671 RepID=A0A1I4JA45_METOL|nr:hypothetical protein [Methanobrevibacter olleyae]SFL63053.1 hypothetical protein SAMN02910297_01378 [Methanobrevibacter olleyae]